MDPDPDDTGTGQSVDDIVTDPSNNQPEDDAQTEMLHSNNQPEEDVQIGAMSSNDQPEDDVLIKPLPSNDQLEEDYTVKAKVDTSDTQAWKAMAESVKCGDDHLQSDSSTEDDSDSGDDDDDDDDDDEEEEEFEEEEEDKLHSSDDEPASPVAGGQSESGEEGASSFSGPGIDDDTSSAQYSGSMHGDEKCTKPPNIRDKSFVKSLLKQNPDLAYLVCSVCHLFFTEPRILPCLHTFCQACVAKKLKEDKFICPRCQQNYTVANGSVNRFQKNKLLMTHVAQYTAKLGGGGVNCAICGLRGEEVVASGHCKECGDDLCDDCCEKHTFSRQTVKHKVVKLSEIAEGGVGASFPRVQVQAMAECKKHLKEELRFFCEVCNKKVCRDCVLLEHSKHICITAVEAAQKRKDKLQEKLTELKASIAQMKSEDLETHLQMLAAEEEKQKEVLKKEFDSFIQVVQSRFRKELITLRSHYKSRQQECKQRLRKSKEAASAASLVELYLEKGSAVELTGLQAILNQHVQKFSASFSKMTPDMKFGWTLPKVQRVEATKKTLKEMNYVQYTDTKTVISQKPQPAADKVILTKTKKKKTEKEAAVVVEQKASPGNKKNKKSKPEAQAGRKKQGIGPAQQEGYCSVQLLLTLNVKAPGDKHEPVITGMTFINPETFAVSDFANQVVKVFDSNGVIVTCFQDPAPMSIICCNDSLIWMSGTKTLFVQPLKGKQKRIHHSLFASKDDIPRPLGCIQPNYYIVGNVKGAQARVYGHTGKGIFQLTPQKPNEDVQYVRSVATGNNDQLVFIDGTTDVLFVTDLEGKCIGGNDGEGIWCPNDVCVDERGNIFVSDCGRNLIVQLGPDGSLMQEWMCMLDCPTHIANNGRGILLVAGKYGVVNVCKYFYE